MLDFNRVVLAVSHTHRYRVNQAMQGDAPDEAIFKPDIG